MDEGEKPKPPSRVKQFVEQHPWVRWAGRLLVVVIAIGVVLWWWNRRKYEGTDDAEVDGYIAPVSPRITGHVTAIHAEDGQFVHAGDLLVEIDARDYQTALAKAKGDAANAEAAADAAQFEVPVSQIGSASQIRSAQADLGVANAGVSAAQKQVEQAQAQLASAQAAAKRANADVERYKPLVEKREIASQQYDEAVAAAAQANAAVDAAAAGVRTTEEQVRQGGERVRQADAGVSNARATTMTAKATASRAHAATAQLQSAKALLAQAELNLNYTTIRAPVGGIVGRRVAQIGQNVEPGQELMTIVPTTGLWVTANYKETQLVRMRQGQPVSISIDGCGADMHGTVTSIGGATGARFSLLPPENATGNYVKVVQRIPVRIDVDPNDAAKCALRPGMSVDPSVKVR
ncbi:MAG TPA: HlyD family secretion protein [Vicinamibacterales bacterium]|nr:HlyD family secretion protein [Vicinamibacterales bacterium]